MATTSQVYIHLKPNGEVFYVGISNNEVRAYDFYRRNKFWKSIVKKHPEFEVQILTKDISYDFAKELEVMLIAYYGRRDLGLGTLCNLTDGGDGQLGRITSEERKKSLSKTTIFITLCSKRMIDTVTGEEFNSCREAAEKNGILYQTLRRYMNGGRKNKTNLIYL